MMRIYSLLSANFSQATTECVEHPHVQAPNQCESRRVKNLGGGGDNAEGESSRHQTLCVCLSTSKCVRVCEREREERGKQEREIRESLK